jgi:Na+/pantothenate symporter
MKPTRIAISLAWAVALLGSQAVAVWLLSFDSKHHGAMWLGLILGPVVIALLVPLGFLLSSTLGDIDDMVGSWWRWLHGNKDKRY